MKTALKFIALFALSMLIGAATAQDAPKPAPARIPLTVKSSKAQELLTKAAKDAAAKEEERRQKGLQAQQGAEQQNKPLIDKMTAQDKPLNDQITANIRAAHDQYMKDTNQISLDEMKSLAVVDSLKEVVKQEQDLPADAEFDFKTQTWTVPAPKK